MINKGITIAIETIIVIDTIQIISTDIKEIRIQLITIDIETINVIETIIMKSLNNCNDRLK